MMLEDPWKLALGLATGILFGFFLQKGQAAKYPVIVGQFLLRDWTVVTIMGTAVIVGTVGVHTLVETGQASLQVKPLDWGGIVAGAFCFGIGIAVLGYCPGTCVAACGEGHPDAWAGLLGMLTGALAYVAARPGLDAALSRWGSLGEVTLPELTGTSPWVWVAGLVMIGIVALALRELQHRSSSETALSRETPGTPREQAIRS